MYAPWKRVHFSHPLTHTEGYRTDTMNPDEYPSEQIQGRAMTSDVYT